MSIRPVVVEFLKCLKNVNENIQCIHGYTYSSLKQKMCTSVNEDSCVMMKTCFPDANQIQRLPKLFYAKNVRMFKKE